MIIICIQFSLFANSQIISLAPRITYMQTIEQTTYTSQFAAGGGVNVRTKAFSWLYIQGGLLANRFESNDTRIEDYRLITWDWQIGFLPLRNIPIHLQIGTLQHRYNFTTKAIEDYGMILVPAIEQQRIWDGWNIGIGYSIKKWFEVQLRFEKEPYYLFKDPHTANYLTLELSFNTSFLEMQESWFAK